MENCLYTDYYIVIKYFEQSIHITIKALFYIEIRHAEKVFNGPFRNNILIFHTNIFW